jgi:hypothetical protein
MNKSRRIQGMLYPEILDKQEYQVTLGQNKPSINRKKATAVTIGDDHCDCSIISATELTEFNEPYNKLINRVQKRDEETRRVISHHNVPKVYDNATRVNHARTIRSHVMYKEMFPLPKFQGTRDIQKEYLERAYSIHRWYRAEYNIANKEARKEHDKQMQERKEQGTWTWHYQSRGAVPRKVNRKEYFCHDIVMQSVHAWLQYETTPIQQVGHILSLTMYKDSGNFLEYTDALIDCLQKAEDDSGGNTTDYLIDKHFAIKRKYLEKPLTSRWTQTEVEMLWKLMHHSDVRWGIGILQQPLHCVDVLEFLHTGMGGLEYAEILRRLINLRQVIDVVHRYQWKVTPYSTITPRGLAKYNKYVKKLAALYQSLCEGSFDEYGKLVPKTIENMEGEGYIPKHYQADNIMTQIDNAVNELTSIDTEIQQSAGKHRWANATFINGNLTKDLAGALRVRRNRPSDVGAVPKYINRWVTDKHVFARKRQSLKGGTVAIDCSGSMHFNAQDIEEVISLLPASTIVGYAGASEAYARNNNMPEGVIEVFAKNQRTIEHYDDTYIYSKGYGENFVDVPAILWLASQPKPRMLVSDMEVVAYKVGNMNSYVYGDELKDYCEDLCHKHDIVILRDIDEAKEFAKTIRKK